MKGSVVTLFTILCLLLIVFLVGFVPYTQLAKAGGTIYIRADGSIDPHIAPINTVDNVTYVFTGNINDSVVVERDNIVVDGSGYTITGDGTGNGITLSDRSNVTLKNAAINNFQVGVHLENSLGNVLSGNNVTANNQYGILLGGSYCNVLSGNILMGNRYNFGLFGSSLSAFTHSIDNSNVVDGKPVYYFVNKTDLVVDPDAYPEVGYLSFVNCANVTVKGLNLTNNGEGLLLAFTNNSKITGNSLTNNDAGIRLLSCSGNVLSGNNASSNEDGIWLYSCSDNVFSGNSASNNDHGILLFYSYNNTLSGNSASNNQDGVYLDHSLGNVLSGNNVAGNDYYGIHLFFSSGNVFSGNNMMANDQYGILAFYSPKNSIFHNSFVNNTHQVSLEISFNNTWDDGYPSGGNYWGDYAGTDYKQGSDQKSNGCDGIGDIEYSIDLYNIDHFPLMGMFSDFNTSLGKCVNVVSNSTIEDFEYLDSNSTIKMHVSGDEGFGFCRVTVPHVLMNVSSISVIIDDGLTPVLYNDYVLYDNGTHRWIYFAYEHSTHEIIIVAELPSFLILTISMIATLLAVIVYKRKIPV